MVIQLIWLVLFRHERNSEVAPEPLFIPEDPQQLREIHDPALVRGDTVYANNAQASAQANASTKAKANTKTQAKTQVKAWLNKLKQLWNINFQAYYTRKGTDVIAAFGDVGAYKWLNNGTVRILLTIFAALVVSFTITMPADGTSQAIILLVFWATALWVRDVQKRGAMLLMVVLSVLVSSRYLYWRVTQTINWDVPTDTVLSLLLLSAELYAWTILILGYVQTIWPLKRHVAKLPSDTSKWPTVDVYIPSYNEPLHVVRPTILAALAMDWPEDKLNVYLLDDGKRSDFAEYAKKVGVGYIVRKDNTHAKAGNLNNALKITEGEFIAIFDCDHIPTRSFLQLAMGWFHEDPKLALLQTPHHFFSPDPF
ncbi:glycosyltransferase, partial [Aliidiomarina sp.]|uniref:glycosyltransferase n=1 Tax=Aliidiomarina sp. TaxID=1872439 RepID=UPI003A4D6C7B